MVQCKSTKRTKQNLRFSHMMAVLKSGCFFTSREAMPLAVPTILFPCYQINAEARTAQKQAALRRLYLFLRYILNVGYSFHGLSQFKATKI